MLESSDRMKTRPASINAPVRRHGNRHELLPPAKAPGFR